MCVILCILLDIKKNLMYFVIKYFERQYFVFKILNKVGHSQIIQYHSSPVLIVLPTIAYHSFWLDAGESYNILLDPEAQS